MISRRWTSAVFEASPGRAVAVCEFLIRAAGIGQVADREYRPWDLLDYFRRGVRPCKIVATGDVTSADENRIIRRSLRILRLTKRRNTQYQQKSKWQQLHFPSLESV